MIIRCPRCSQKLTIPDEWAGRSIRCPACNKGVQVPRPREATRSVHGDDLPDLESLASLEVGTEELDRHALAEAEAAAVAVEPKSPKRSVRACPHCGKEVHAKDPYSEVLCSHCAGVIPAQIGAGGLGGSGVLDWERRRRDTSTGGFYANLAGVFTYPLGGVGSLLTAILVAVVVILIPVAVVTGLARTTEQSNVGTAQMQYGELTSVQSAVMFFILIELQFFIMVALHLVVDATRATSVGQEKPPPIEWNPAEWGETLAGIVAIVLANLLVLAGVIWGSTPGFFSGIRTPGDLDVAKLANPVVIVTALLLGLAFPMNLIGLACGKLIEALNPVRIARSMLRTHVHYVFLVLMFLMLNLMFFAVAYVIFDWFGGQLKVLQSAASKGDLVGLAGGLVSWGIVNGLAMYCSYLLGRVLGLFARSFRTDLDFVG